MSGDKKFYYREDGSCHVEYVPIPQEYVDLLTKVLEQNQKIIDTVVAAARERTVGEYVCHEEEERST